MVRLDRQTLLLKIVRTLHPTRSLTSRLDGRQQQSNQDANDGDDHQKLDQREPLLVRAYRKPMLDHQNDPSRKTNDKKTIEVSTSMNDEIPIQTIEKWTDNTVPIR
jgi:hypothetical protein